MEPMPTSAADVAADVVGSLAARGLTLATAESLTGGGVGALVTSVPGSSAVYVGGVIAYASRLKVELLGVPDDVVERFGVVSARCARAMAAGVRRLGADVGVSTTGVAGPDPQDGIEPGVVHIGVSGPDVAEVRTIGIDGNRHQVRAGAVAAALGLLSKLADQRD